MVFYVNTKHQAVALFTERLLHSFFENLMQTPSSKKLHSFLSFRATLGVQNSASVGKSPAMFHDFNLRSARNSQPVIERVILRRVLIIMCLENLIAFS